MATATKATTKTTTTTKAKAPAKEAPKAAATPKAQAKQQPRVDLSKMVTVSIPVTKKPSDKTVYHVSKRDRDGREWKVFIQESDKVIKLFATQDEALTYAKGLAKSKGNGSYVVLHGLNGQIRKY